MKIVALDGYTSNPGDISWNAMAAQGDFVCYDRTAKDEIDPRIGDADAVLTNKVPISRATMEKAPNLKYIGVLATGYNIIDLDAARDKGIVVTNIPGYSTVSVAQFVFALLLEACRRVGHHSRVVREGKWTRCKDFVFWDYPLIELDGKTLGIVGYGAIGLAVARIAAAFGMKVLANNRNPEKVTESETVKRATLEEVYAGSDMVSFHVPLFDSTKGMINSSSIAAMKDGVIIVNTARGALAVEGDVAKALESGKVYVYAADVATVEPINADSPLLTAKNCILTPHIAWAPKEARLRLLDIAAGNLRAFAAGKPVNAVG
ncbi:MAG: D-2-hydroxyacid dehydrogenase [Planctomycetota bacterium]|jgi:glycerate dehydrogenase|nr:D-2-hydroxyacid dehydrogenase [Planctomycetota bacterium]